MDWPLLLLAILTLIVDLATICYLTYIHSDITHFYNDYLYVRETVRVLMEQVNDIRIDQIKKMKEDNDGKESVEE